MGVSPPAQTPTNKSDTENRQAYACRSPTHRERTATHVTSIETLVTNTNPGVRGRLECIRLLTGTHESSILSGPTRQWRVFGPRQLCRSDHRHTRRASLAMTTRLQRRGSVVDGLTAVLIKRSTRFDSSASYSWSQHRYTTNIHG